MQARFGYVHEAVNLGYYIVKYVELYPTLGLSELRLPEHAKAKVYRCRVQGRTRCP